MAPVNPTTRKLKRSKPYQRLLSTLPPPAKNNINAARQELGRRLTCALRNYEGSSDGGRRGARMAVAAAYHFIAAAAPQCAGKFTLFNMVLVAALSDLDRGVVTPLVKKVGNGRKTDGFAYKDIQHRAAATMRSLMDIGFNRNDAAKNVAETLYRNGFDATPRAVEKWYDERIPAELKQERRPGKSTQRPKDQSEGYAFYVAVTNGRVNSLKGKGYKQKKISEELLDELRCFIRLWFPVAMRGATQVSCP
jgi:hypothetical protein